jgi:hypothetical protein
MKLSELVGYLYLLNQEDIDPDYDLAMRKFQSMSHVIANHAVQFHAVSNDFTAAVDQLQQAFGQVDHVVASLKDQIFNMIQQMETDQFKKNETWYLEEAPTMSNDHILTHNRLRIDNDGNILLRARLKNYTDWRIPGMIIRPAQESFIEDLVPMDPLYLVDHNLELLQPAISAFTPEYQRRLRPYAVNDYQDEHPLWQLPNNQFGLVFVWNYFQFKPLSVVRRYLTDIYKKLRPGGVCIFTYNECDREYGVQSAEQNFMCYTPGRLIRKHAEFLGFEIINNHHGPVTWLEIKRPGEIESLRGGQSLAKIVAI